jgi:hypothetical protein
MKKQNNFQLVFMSKFHEFVESKLCILSDEQDIR